MCISVVAGSFAGGTALALLAPDATTSGAATALAATGAAGLGTALFLIHIYVTPLKRMLQLFWAAGVAGGAYLLATQGDASLPHFVAAHPVGVWAIGPAFAALTGLTFKEGVCYGKPEAFALTLLMPALLLGHLTGLGAAADGGVDAALAALTAGLLLVFAARKYTQPVKDDIGDGSVFAFQRLSPEEQEAALRRLGRAGGDVWEEE